MLAGMTTTTHELTVRNPRTSELPGLLADLDESGLGVAAFCREHRLKPQNIYAARRRQRQADEPAAVFDAVRVIGGLDSQSAFTVDLRSGHKVSVPADFDPKSLLRLLEILATC